MYLNKILTYSGINVNMKTIKCGSCGSKELDIDQEEINRLADSGCLCMMTLRRKLIREGKWELAQD